MLKLKFSTVCCGSAMNVKQFIVLLVVCLANGIESLFPVQSMSFDAIYDGYDVIVQASK